MAAKFGKIGEYWYSGALCVTCEKPLEYVKRNGQFFCCHKCNPEDEAEYERNLENCSGQGDPEYWQRLQDGFDLIHAAGNGNGKD